MKVERSILLKYDSYALVFVSGARAIILSNFLSVLSGNYI